MIGSGFPRRTIRRVLGSAAIAGLLWGAWYGGRVAAQAGDADQRSAVEVRALFDQFNQAWERRDLGFVERYFAHDPDMLLFFERRQLEGWPRVQTLYRNMFANASGGKVTSTVSNVRVGARGDMAWLAANFHLQVADPSGETTVDEGRQSVVFERRDRRWVVVHRHTSFQAPPGPERHVSLHTEPGPLWDPTLEGAWRQEGGRGLMVATAGHVAFAGLTRLPGGATYTVDGTRLRLGGLEEGVPDLVLDELEITSTRVSFVVDTGSQRTKISWRRVE